MLAKEIFSIIKEINRTGTTILLVEQNAHMALLVANRPYVMETGEIVLQGTAEQMANNPKVKKHIWVNKYLITLQHQPTGKTL